MLGPGSFRKVSLSSTMRNSSKNSKTRNGKPVFCHLDRTLVRASCCSWLDKTNFLSTCTASASSIYRGSPVGSVVLPNPPTKSRTTIRLSLLWVTVHWSRVTASKSVTAFLGSISLLTTLHFLRMRRRKRMWQHVQQFYVCEGRKPYPHARVRSHARVRG